MASWVIHYDKLRKKAKRKIIVFLISVIKQVFQKFSKSTYKVNVLRFGQFGKRTLNFIRTVKI